MIPLVESLEEAKAHFDAYGDNDLPCACRKPDDYVAGITAHTYAEAEKYYAT